MFTFRRAETDEDLESVYRLRYQVYCVERGFEDPSDHPTGLERDEYDECSWHYLALDENGQALGTTRLIRPQGRPYPIELHTEIEQPIGPEIRPEHLGELSRMAVSKNYRRRAGDTIYGFADGPAPESHGDRRGLPILFLGLLREMYLDCMEHGVTHLYAAMERKLYLLVRRYGFVFHRIGPEIDYHGWRAPHLLSIAEFERRSRNRRPDVHAYFREGVPPEYTAEAIERTFLQVRA